MIKNFQFNLNENINILILGYKKIRTKGMTRPKNSFNCLECKFQSLHSNRTKSITALALKFHN